MREAQIQAQLEHPSIVPIHDVGRTADFGEVYVLDWGIAHLEGSADPGLASPVASLGAVVATVTGTVIGTPGYMSPEQARGDLTVLDGRTDVYALGAILFELLCLEPLHPRGSATAAMASTLSGADARPSERPRGLDVPPELDAICVSATALAPGDRLASVRVLSDAVERFLDGDRDLALRRRLAADHAAQAAAMADAAVGDDDEAPRARAMQEVGRALALDADNHVARHAMIRLLTTPPRVRPAEARAALDASALESQRFAARTGAISYLNWTIAVPIGLWMGVVDRGVVRAARRGRAGRRSSPRSAAPRTAATPAATDRARSARRRGARRR